MLIEIKKQLVPNQNKYSFGKGNPCNYITIHETANTSRGAGARNHANYQANGNVGYGWHYQVDDKEIIQSYEDTYKVWHAGDGTGIGNTQSLSFEICVNTDSDFEKAVDNTAKAVAMKMKEHGIPLSNIKQHYDHIGKNCPYNLRNNTKGISWQDFLNLVKKYRNQLDDKPKQTNSKGDIDMWKVQVGAFENKADAERLAKELNSKGYATYTYWEDDNKPQPKPRKTTAELAREVLDGKHGNGEARRKSLGSRYAEVQAEVNRLLPN